MEIVLDILGNNLDSANFGKSNLIDRRGNELAFFFLKFVRLRFKIDKPANDF